MFLSDENKGFLWDVMSDNEIFKKEIDNNVLNVKKNFDALLKEVNDNNTDTELLDLNKIFLVEFNKVLSNNKLITSKEIKNERISDFEKRLKMRQNDFDNSMKKENPEEINFKDTSDQPLLNVEDELQKKIQQRKYDNINVEEGNIEEGKKWLGIDVSENILTKIEEIHNLPVNKEDDNFKIKKDTDIFSKLKKIDNEFIATTTSKDAYLENFNKLERKLDMIIENMQKNFK